MLELISVIVPIYKAEKCLDRCIQSVVNQTYKNLEIILVNDGSPDRCPQMCNEWEERDSRIKAIHKNNGGVSTARNKGIQIAKGKYILFVDSDDYLKKTCVECLYELVKKYDAQIGIGGTCYEQNEKNVAVIKTNYMLVDREFNIARIKYSNAAWGILYDTELIHGNKIWFDTTYYYGEDTLFFYKNIKCAKKVAYTNDKLYVHLNNLQGACNADWDEKRWTGVESCEEKIETVKCFPKTYIYEKIHYKMGCLYNLDKLIDGKGKKEQAAYLYKQSWSEIFSLLWKIFTMDYRLIEKIKLIKVLFSPILRIKMTIKAKKYCRKK